MTVSELRTLVDNLEEYIHVPGGIDRLKKMALHLAVSGQLVPQDPSEGTGEELYRQIQAEKAELVKQGKIKKQKPLPANIEHEVPFAIPKSWKWSTLAGIGQIIGGGTPSSTQPSYYTNVDTGGIPWLTPADLRGYTSIYITHGSRNITIEGLKNSSARLMPKGTVLFSSRAPIGHIAIASNDITTNQGFKSIVPSGDIYSEYVYRWLQYYGPEIDSNASGTTFREVSGSIVERQLIPLPPLAEQKRIITKIDSIFTLIDQLSEVYKSEQAERSKLVASSLAQLAKGEGGVGDSLALKHLSEIIRTKADSKILRQTILHLAVSGQLVSQDPPEGSGEDLYKQIQDEKAELVKQGKIKKHPALSEVGDDEIPYAIPTSWKWVRQADIFDITSSKRVMQSDWKKSGIPFLRARDLTAAIKTNEISSDIFVSQDYFDSVKKISGVPQPGDLMVSGVGTIGTPYIVKDGDEFYFKDATILWFKNFSNVSPKFMKQVLLSSYMKKKVKSQSQGTTVDTYTIANARMNIVPLPPLAEQKRIVAKTTRLLDLVSELEKHLEK